MRIPVNVSQWFIVLEWRTSLNTALTSVFSSVGHAKKEEEKKLRTLTMISTKLSTIGMVSLCFQEEKVADVIARFAAPSLERVPHLSTIRMVSLPFQGEKVADVVARFGSPLVAVTPNSRHSRMLAKQVANGLVRFAYQ